MTVVVWQSSFFGTKLAQFEMSEVEFKWVTDMASTTPLELNERQWRVHGWGTDTFRAEDSTPLAFGFLVVMEWTP